MTEQVAEVFLRRLSRWQAEQQREAVAGLHLEAYGDREGFLERFEHQVQQPEFDMVAADAAGLVGCLYGHRAEPDGAWWRAFSGLVPSRTVGQHPVPERVFVLRELMVAPTHRRQGIASRLRALLLVRHAGELVVAELASGSGDELGRAVLRAWGWVPLGGFEDGEGLREGWMRPLGES
ncbi:GNAT family N-acetyltransferase [Streptomyces sp. NPDC059009]|uniref:GNAT family N-acetyltransferase n=1 Tax=Streptomyces sp. NPDC059009 TaxID=3346694 RepID=UPI00367BBD76